MNYLNCDLSDCVWFNEQKNVRDRREVVSCELIYSAYENEDSDFFRVFIVTHVTRELSFLYGNDIMSFHFSMLCEVGAYALDIYKSYLKANSILLATVEIDEYPYMVERIV